MEIILQCFVKSCPNFIFELMFFALAPCAVQFCQVGDSFGNTVWTLFPSVRSHSIREHSKD